MPHTFAICRAPHPTLPSPDPYNLQIPHLNPYDFLSPLPIAPTSETLLPINPHHPLDPHHPLNPLPPLYAILTLDSRPPPPGRVLSTVLATLGRLRFSITDFPSAMCNVRYL